MYIQVLDVVRKAWTPSEQLQAYAQVTGVAIDTKETTNYDYDIRDPLSAPAGAFRATACRENQVSRCRKGQKRRAAQVSSACDRVWGLAPSLFFRQRMVRAIKKSTALGTGAANPLPIKYIRATHVESLLRRSDRKVIEQFGAAG